MPIKECLIFHNISIDYFDPTTMAASPVIFVIVYAFIALSTSISTFFLMSTIIMIRRNEQQERQTFSPILRYYFWVLLIVSTAMLIHASTVLIIWRDDLKLPLTPLFVTGTIDGIFMPIVPFTSFMLTVDRCLVLLLEQKYKQPWKIVLLFLNFLISAIVSGMTLVFNILFHRSELPNGCIAYGCMLYINAQLLYTYCRTIGAILGAVAGISFLIINSRLKKKNPQIGTRMTAIAEAIVFRAVIFELICDFAPHAVDTIMISVTDDSPFGYIGPYSRFIVAIDLLLNSTINWLVFARAKKMKVSTATITIMN